MKRESLCGLSYTRPQRSISEQLALSHHTDHSSQGRTENSLTADAIKVDLQSSFHTHRRRAEAITKVPGLAGRQHSEHGWITRLLTQPHSGYRGRSEQKKRTSVNDNLRLRLTCGCGRRTP
ncbi:hypothetical protein JZ751_002881 [Albula glossodonta]|uniref:Uncharacterized protein n=1 Tax=Albula glossodonta TaxID=121402 RepID=A0A8T2N9A9_9TELE|nr:hypothetical protein JZ751_002881 [Albula glossodonta]